MFAGLLTGAALLAIWWVSANGPSRDLRCDPIPRTDGSLRCVPKDSVLDATWQTAFANVGAAVLAIGLISLLFDLALRKRYGTDLLRYLGIKEAMVRSGMSELSTGRKLDLESRFPGIDRFVYLGRAPGDWLSPNFARLLRAAETRQMDILVALPNPDLHASVGSAAVGLGRNEADLAESIRVFLNQADQDWKASEPTLRAGTTLRVVYVDEPPLYDAIHATGVDALVLSKPLNAVAGDETLALTFEDGDPAFPAGWLEAALQPLNGANDALNRRKDP